MNYKNLKLQNLFIIISIFGAIWATNTLVSPTIHYHLQQSAFLIDSTYFTEFLTNPGGISDYISESITGELKVSALALRDKVLENPIPVKKGSIC